MGTTVNRTFRVAYPDGFRDEFECDGATVQCKALDANGDPTGAYIELATGAVTAPAMEQWHPGLFKYTTTNLPLTRGSSYRAYYTITVGGVAGDVIEQDFIAESDLTTAADTSDFHQFTALQLRDVVRRVLGLQDSSDTENGPQEAGSADTLEIVNDALQNLWREHRWLFQTSDRFYMDFVAHQHRYLLPLEFLSLKALTRRDDRTWRMVPKPLEWIQARRQQRAESPATVTYYCILSDPPDEKTQQQRWVLEVWPTPAEYVQSALVLEFEREFQALCEDDEIAPVPLGYQSLVKQAVRAEACEQEQDEHAEMERAKFDRMLAAARKYDSRHSEVNLGSMIDRSRPDDADGDWDAYAAHDPYYQ